jgi:hypothetical protein
VDFDTWHHWLLLRPLIVFLLAGPLLVLAALVGLYTKRREEKRTHEAKGVRVATVIEDAASWAEPATACKELVRRRVEAWPWPRERDGGQPRPNWNRRSG